jgi:bla regulator protein blaR1
MQKLLADRFKLAFHRDRRELSVYAFTVAKSGPKMTKNDSDPNGLPALFFRGLGMLPARNANMAAAAGRRARSTGRRSNRTRRTI